MRLSLRRFELTKAVPLAISRGSSSGSTRLLVTLEHGGITGLGETGPFDTGHRHFDADVIASELQAIAPRIATLTISTQNIRTQSITTQSIRTQNITTLVTPREGTPTGGTSTGGLPEQVTEQVLEQGTDAEISATNDTANNTAHDTAIGPELPSATLESLLSAVEPLLDGVSPPARCGLDLALQDWWGQRQGLPLHQLWGLDPGACVATSVTLGLGTTEAVLARLEQWWLQLPASRIKLKLGSPDGLDHDRELVCAVAERLRQRQQQCGQTCELQVDANGGWDLEAARAMAPWLAMQGVVLLEQPLAPLCDADADTAGFAALKPDCPLPLIADESCWNRHDLHRLAPYVDGINIKLLKSGGLGEALAMAREARSKGLRVMVGCYGDGSLLNGAAAQLLPLVDWPDLDSHLNLIDDPFMGLEIRGDVLQPPSGPGLGIRWRGPLPR